MSSLLRPRDTDAVRAALRRIAAEGDVPVLFGGEVHEDALLLSEFVGTRTAGLRGLVVRSNSGLGGATMVAGRPLSVSDYRNAASISHDYDAPVLTEGIRSVLAVPVVVDGSARAILYGAYRSGAPFGGLAADLMVGSARRLAHELRVRDEVDRRMRLLEARMTGAANPETIREVYAGLRTLAAGADTETATELHRLAELLSAPAAAEFHLSPRELDVLAQIALGCTNAEAAERLSLKTETVKSYLRSAAGKLGTKTRHEAVSKARRAGLIP